MIKKQKILVIRFSSIGDIILTTPVVRELKQKNFIIHFLTKFNNISTIKNNIFIDKIYVINKSIYEIVCDLKEESYDVIVDLHNNLRSNFLRIILGVRTLKIRKNNLAKFLFINFGIDLLNNQHVVNRNLKVISTLVNDKYDDNGLDFFIDFNSVKIHLTEDKYIVWSLSGSHDNKKLTFKIINEVLLKIDIPIVFIGGNDDFILADKLVKSHNKKIHNYCGKTTLDESAAIINNCIILLSNDTGMMHLGAALKKPIISFWGCTKPSLGFYPYQSNNFSEFVVSRKYSRPCSRHGQKCRGKNKCITSISSEEILMKLQLFFDKKSF
tara:strand:+ start:583 stop:1560 length:978 start_codon:yes stop_codon:yes gene_type:complete